MLTWKETNREAFLECVGSILNDPQVQKLAEFHQHTEATTRYDHCVLVAYLSFLMCRRFGWDYQAAARGPVPRVLAWQRGWCTQPLAYPPGSCVGKCPLLWLVPAGGRHHPEAYVPCDPGTAPL